MTLVLVQFFLYFIPKSQHRMKRYNSQKQLSIAEFSMPFETNLDKSNQWIVLSPVIAWDKFV